MKLEEQKPKKFENVLKKIATTLIVFTILYFGGHLVIHFFW